MCLTTLALFFLPLFRSSLALMFFAPWDRAVSDCTSCHGSKPARSVSVPSQPVTCIKCARHSAKPPPSCYRTFLIHSSTWNKGLTRTWQTLVFFSVKSQAASLSQFTEFLLQWVPLPSYSFCLSSTALNLPERDKTYKASMQHSCHRNSFWQNLWHLQNCTG